MLLGFVVVVVVVNLMFVVVVVNFMFMNVVWCKGRLAISHT